MSKDYSLSGVHVLNRWLWQKLKATFPDDFVKYTAAGQPTTGMVPIIPSQQLPQFTDIAGGAPFMIYNYSIEPGTDIWKKSDKVGYVIYDDNEARLRRIHTYMVELLARMDWTAAEINNFIAADVILNEFDFKFVQVDNAAGPQPFTSDGGRHGAVVMITAMYTRDMINNPGLLGNGLGMRS